MMHWIRLDSHIYFMLVFFQTFFFKAFLFQCAFFLSRKKNDFFLFFLWNVWIWITLLTLGFETLILFYWFKWQALLISAQIYCFLLSNCLVLVTSNMLFSTLYLSSCSSAPKESLCLISIAIILVFCGVMEIAAELNHKQIVYQHK